MASLSKMQQIERDKLGIVSRDVNSFLSQLDRSLVKLNARIVTLTSTLEMEGGLIKGTTANLHRAQSMRGQIVGLLDETAFNRSIAGLSKTYNAVTAKTGEGLKAAGIDPKFTRGDARALTAIKEMDFRRWQAFSTELVDTVQRSIIDSVVSGDRLSVMADSIADTLLGIGEKPSLIRSRAQTLANTYIQSFDRTVTARKAQQAGIKTFIYLGPDDELTRPFCDDVLAGNKNNGFNIPGKSGKVIYTLSEIESMNNGTPLNPLNFGGGYNCRHKFRPISKELAKDIKA